MLVTKVADAEGDGYSLSLDYSKIALLTQGIDDAGKISQNGAFGYDLAAAKAIAPFSLALSPGDSDVAAAPAKYFLALDGLAGDSFDDEHVGWFEVSGFDIDLGNLGSASTGSGSGTGKAVFSPLTLTLDNNTGLASFLALAATGKHLDGATLIGVTDGAKAQDKVYQLDLGDVLVTKVVEDRPGPDAQPRLQED